MSVLMYPWLRSCSGAIRHRLRLQASVVPQCKTAFQAVSPESDVNGTSSTTFSISSRQFSGAGEHGAAAPMAFDDHKAVFEGKSTSDLLRAYMIFRMCGIPSIVNNAESLIKYSRRLIGDTMTFGVVRHTFFRHFCAGETDAEVQKSMRALTDRGVGGILDFAAEDDVSDTPPPLPGVAASDSKADPSSKVVARTYAYASEVLCDKHVDTFLSSIATAAKMGGQGFVAIKLTALGNPHLLERVSSSVVELMKLFKVFDLDGNGTVSREEFESVYHKLVPNSDVEEQRRVFEWMDTQQREGIDYVSWCQRLDLRKISERVRPGPHPALLREGTPEWQRRLYERLLTPEELDLVKALEGRVTRLAEAAVAQGVRLMVDAEHTYFQPAIDHVVHRMMRLFNTGEQAFIYTTCQAYLKDAHSRLLTDMERARREGFKFGVKLVRGAYLELERRRASQLGYDSPVWDSIQQTHDSYDMCLLSVLEQVAARRVEVMFGSHNQESIQHVVTKMALLGLPPTSGVFFGQLLGMSDHLTYTLGRHGYKAYKYVPYGAVSEVIPYLLRRATENAHVIGHTKKDLQLIERELIRRFTFRS